MNPYLTGAGRSLLLAAIAFIAVGALAGQWPVLLFGVLLSGALLVAFYAMLPSVLVLERRLLRVQLSPPDAGQQGSLLTGQPIVLRLKVENRAGAGLRGLRLVPHLASGLSLVRDVAAELRLPGHSEVESDMTLVALETGRWAVHGFEVRIRDALGLFEVGEYVGCPTVLKVLPDVVASRGERPPSLKALAQQRAGLHFVVRRGFGMELRELRNHQHGDPFRSIAWKATARTGRLMVKEYESELVLDTYVCLDISSTMRGGYRHEAMGVASKLEHAVRLGFAFADMAVHSNDRVGLITFDEKLYGHLRPREGRGQLSNVLHHMVGLRQIVDAELTEYTDVEVIETLVHYLLVQERLDFRRRQRARMVRGVGQGMDYWSFSRDIETANREEPAWDLDLLEQWLALAVPQEEQRLGDPSLDVGLVSADVKSLARRFCQLRGIELPYRVETRLGQKERGMVQGFEALLTHARDGHFVLVVTDLCGIMSPEPIVRALRLLVARRHKIVFVTPFTPDYVEPGAPNTRAGALHDIFRRAERRERKQVARAIEQVGVPVIEVGPRDDLSVVLRRLRQRVR